MISRALVVYIKFQFHRRTLNQLVYQSEKVHDTITISIII